jgi:hypothetical protein
MVWHTPWSDRAPQIDIAAIPEAAPYTPASHGPPDPQRTDNPLDSSYASLFLSYHHHHPRNMHHLHPTLYAHNSLAGLSANASSTLTPALGLSSLSSLSYVQNQHASIVHLTSSSSDSLVATLASQVFDALAVILPGRAASHPNSFISAVIEVGGKLWMSMDGILRVSIIGSPRRRSWG